MYYQDSDVNNPYHQEYQDPLPQEPYEPPAPEEPPPSSALPPAAQQLPQQQALAPPAPTQWTTGPMPSAQSVSDMVSRLRQARESSDPHGRAAGFDSVSRELSDLLAKQGHDIKWQGQQIVIDGRPYVIGGTDPSKEWLPSSTSGYQPGEIPTDDIPNFSFESLMEMMATPEVDALVNSILANPESLDARTVEMMKAATKDELAEMDIENQQQLDTLGTSYGIQESPWIGAQKMQARRDRDNALVQSNRAIDMEAAETNMADRRAAAELGTAHGAQKQSKVMAAASTALARSAALGDRLALRETVKQKAAELDMRAEELLANHIQHRLDSMTKLYDIDVRSSDTRYGAQLDARTRLQISANQLAMADQHFLEDLAFKIEELDSLEQERRRGQARWEEEHALNIRQQDWLEQMEADEAEV